jgi:hypothetical protein
VTALALPSSYPVETASWDDAVSRMDWRPGEHVTLIAPTGAGKTELISRLMEPRRYNLFLGTKRIDATQDRLARERRLRRIKSADELNPELGTGFYFKPDWPRRLGAKRRREYHAAAFREVLEASFWQTRWTTYADELRVLAHILGLTDEIVEQLIQGRSQKSSLVSGAQRPRFVPLEAYDQASHLFLWRDNDAANINRISELAGLNRQRVTEIVPTLARHDTLYVQTFTGDMFVTNTRW